MAASEDEIIRLWHVWKVDESVMKSKTSVTAAAHKHFPTTGNIR
jgi:hypothetical protein